MRSKKDGIKATDWKKHSDKKESRTHNKKVREAGKAEAKAPMKEEDEESVAISNFIQCVGDKNYAQAHKYLTDVVNNKIANRIEVAASQPLFN